MHVYIVHVAFLPKLARPESAESSNLCGWASEHSARTAEFSPKRCRFCKNWPFASSKITQHCIPHGVDSNSIVFLWMIWSSGATRYQTNITSCMPRRPRHFPICLKPIKGMSLTTSQAVSVTLLYRLHDDALMSKTKEFLQPHWGVGILLFGASLARHINQFTRWAPKIHQSLSTSFPAEFWGNVLQLRNSKQDSGNFRILQFFESNHHLVLYHFPTVSPPFPGLLGYSTRSLWRQGEVRHVPLQALRLRALQQPR